MHYMVNANPFNNYFSLNILKVIGYMTCEIKKTLQWIIMKIYIAYNTNLKVDIYMKVTLVACTKQSTNCNSKSLNARQITI